MKPLSRNEIVGRRISEVIVSAPDKPVSMSDQSSSKGYVRLENGVVIDLDAQPPLHAIEESSVRGVARDSATEAELQEAVGLKIEDVRFDQSLLYVLIEGGRMISIVPAQFWVRPHLEGIESVGADACSIW